MRKSYVYQLKTPNPKKHKFSVIICNIYDLFEKHKIPKLLGNTLIKYQKKQPFFSCYYIKIISFPVWRQKRLLSAGLKPVLSQTEKLCKTSNYRHIRGNLCLYYDAINHLYYRQNIMYTLLKYVIRLDLAYN